MISRIATFRLLSCSLPFERERNVLRAKLWKCADSIRLDRAIAFSSRFELPFAADAFIPFKAAILK